MSEELKNEVKEVKKPEVKAEPAQPTTKELSAFEQYAKIALVREERLNREEEAKVAQVERKKQQYASNSSANEKQEEIKKANCKHLKGGRHTVLGQNKDFNVGQHTFINGATYIKCFTCRMKWKPNDTAEYLVVDNGSGPHRVPNYTKIGWAEAMQMVASSTNRATSSEIPVRVEIPDYENASN